jgi:tetratricopeptide (TPR) repeat protein
MPAAAAPARPYNELVVEAKRALETGRNRRALELYQQALAQQPAGADALTGLAYVHLDRGQAGKAISLFKQVLAHDGQHAPALFGLGEAYREQGQRQAALEAFKQYLAAQPAGPDAEIAKRQIQQLASATAQPPG